MQPESLGPRRPVGHGTRLEKLARDKHSSFFRKSVNYGHNKFYSADNRSSFIKRFCNKFTHLLYNCSIVKNSLSALNTFTLRKNE